MDIKKRIYQFSVKALLFLIGLQMFSLFGLTQNYKWTSGKFSMNPCQFISCVSPSELHAETIDDNDSNNLQESAGVYLTVFGPKKYIRTTGKPNVYLDTFPSQSLTSPDGIITILNGEQDGSHRISSALIYVNEEQIFGPSDFNQQVFELKTAIKLTDINNLKIEMRSKTRGYLIILMEQYVLAPPTVTIDANPGLIQQGDSSILTWSSNNSDSCIIEPGIGTVDTSGSILVTPVETTSYTITAMGLDNSASQSVTIFVNHKPIANAGSDQTGHINEIIQLDGSLSSDPDGDALTYQWTFLHKPDGSNTNLSNYTSVKPTFVPDAHGTYEFQLLLSDGMVKSEPDAIVFTTLNRPPVIICPPITTGIENIEYTYDVEATDPDNDTLTYTLIELADGLTIDPSTGLILWTPTSNQIGLHSVAVEVTDGHGGFDSQAFIITVAGINHPPNITSYPQLTNICDPPGDAFEEFQAIPTNGALDWESFEINGETYLAVANHYNDSTYSIDSKIFKWDGNTFVEEQSIPTNRAIDWESFVIEGETYLAVANNRLESNHNIDSKIYKWNGILFEEIQSIPTIGAYDWEGFEIEGETYLALANYRNNVTRNVNSKIYRWNSDSFVEVQSIPTMGACDWESFMIDGEIYLAVANWRDGSDNYNIDSKIYKWNGILFEEIQSVPTHAAHDWESFEINGETYLAMANCIKGQTRNTDSIVYKWNGNAFVEFQRLPTHGATHWESFVLDREMYLAVANVYNDITRNIDSVIYKWDDSAFVEVQFISTIGAFDLHNFTIDGETYLAVANERDDSTYNTDSKIYKWNGTCFDAALLNEGAQYTYDVEAIDLDGDLITYSLANNPQGMSIDVFTGLITWWPNPTQMGTYEVEIQVTDGRGGTNSQTYIISIE